jgi:hypothetical protein
MNDTDNNGGKTDYYNLPTNATTLDDLIDFKNMTFGRGNMFKAIYRLGEKGNTSEIYDLNKIAYYVQRRLDILNSGKPKMTIEQHKEVYKFLNLFK